MTMNPDDLFPQGLPLDLEVIGQPLEYGPMRERIPAGWAERKGYARMVSGDLGYEIVGGEEDLVGDDGGNATFERMSAWNTANRYAVGGAQDELQGRTGIERMYAGNAAYETAARVRFAGAAPEGSGPHRNVRRMTRLPGAPGRTRVGADVAVQGEILDAFAHFFQRLFGGPAHAATAIGPALAPAPTQRRVRVTSHPVTNEAQIEEGPAYDPETEHAPGLSDGAGPQMMYAPLPDPGYGTPLAPDGAVPTPAPGPTPMAAFKAAFGPSAAQLAAQAQVVATAKAINDARASFTAPGVEPMTPAQAQALDQATNQMLASQSAIRSTVMTPEYMAARASAADQERQARAQALQALGPVTTLPQVYAARALAQEMILFAPASTPDRANLLAQTRALGAQYAQLAKGKTPAELASAKAEARSLLASSSPTTKIMGIGRELVAGALAPVALGCGVAGQTMHTLGDVLFELGRTTR